MLARANTHVAAKKQMSKKHQFIITLLPVVLLLQTVHAAPLQTLSLDFRRELTENGKTERIAGTLHYDLKSSRVVVEVTKPLKQIMVVKGKILEIYYPEQEQAFRFISERPIPLPFIESILQATQAEYSLTAPMGYTLDKHEVVDKVLYTYWKPPEKEKETLGVVILGMHEDRLISAEVKNSVGYIVARTLYKEHKEISNNYIPMHIIASTYGEKSEVLRHEKIFYNNPQVNVKPINPIFNFTIPASVEVKEMKW